MPLAKIDILIPAIEKDLGTLPMVIDGLRKYVKHPIGNLYIVSPKSNKMIALCRRKGCKFVDENTVLPITKKQIHYRSQRWDRSGWLFQQLLKLSGDAICEQNLFLVVDADTVFIRPHIFRIGQKTICYRRNWSQPEYFRAYSKLFGKKAQSPSSFVAHYMLLEKSKLQQLKRTLEARHHKSWYSAIIQCTDKTKQFGFSEFETYGNFVYANYPNQLIMKPCLNKSFHMNARQLSPLQITRMSRTFRSLSFHKRGWYYRKPKVVMP